MKAAESIDRSKKPSFLKKLGFFIFLMAQSRSYLKIIIVSSLFLVPGTFLHLRIEQGQTFFKSGNPAFQKCNLVTLSGIHENWALSASFAFLRRASICRRFSSTLWRFDNSLCTSSSNDMAIPCGYECREKSGFYQKPDFFYVLFMMKDYFFVVWDAGNHSHPSGFPLAISAFTLAARRCGPSFSMASMHSPLARH